MHTGLTDALVTELKEWEESYYDSLTADQEWETAEAARAFTERGIRLAHRVAAELGPRFTVSFASYETGAETVVARSEAPALNRAAEEAFIDLREALEADEREAAELRRNGGEWSAYAPLSGTTFTPKEQNGPGTGAQR